jgi:hypothetical protein
VILHPFAAEHSRVLFCRAEWPSSESESQLSLESPSETYSGAAEVQFLSEYHKIPQVSKFHIEATRYQTPQRY